MTTSLVEARLLKDFRKARFSSGMAMLIFISVFAVTHYFLDNVSWEYRGYGVWIWAVFAFMLVFGWFMAATLTVRLTANKEFKSVEGLRLQGYSMTTAELKALVAKVAVDAGFKPDDYKLYVVSDQTPNAFAAGTGSSRMIALHAGILDAMPRQQLEGVVAHEFGHLKHNDIFLLVFVNSAILSFVLLGRFFFELAKYSFFVKDDSSSKKKIKSDLASLSLTAVFLIISSFLTIVGYVFAPIVAAFLSRRREDMADGFAASIGHGVGLQGALAILDKAAAKTKPRNKEIASLYISAPEVTLIERIFSSHPPVMERIEKISKVLSTDEGVVPDVLENLFWNVFKWVFLPLVGLAILGITGGVEGLPGFWWVPYAYVAPICWLGTLDVLLSIGITSTKARTSNAVTLSLGIMLLVMMWMFGLWAAHESSFLVNSIVPFAVLATPMFYIWLIKPVVAFLGIEFGMMALISELINFVSLAYAFLMIATVLANTLGFGM
jgi:Zn-dependent protease with chaperone function